MSNIDSVPKNCAVNYPYRLVIHDINGKNVYSDYFKFLPDNMKFRDYVSTIAIVLASEGFKNIPFFQVELIERKTIIIETIGKIIGEKEFVSASRIHRCV